MLGLASRGHNGRGLHLHCGPFTLCKAGWLCYRRQSTIEFPGSSVVEQPAVRYRLVAGSNPARGANKFKRLKLQINPRIFSEKRFGATFGQQTAGFAVTDGIMSSHCNAP